MATMKDIADRLGISKGTVSLVMSGKAGTRVSAETKEKIMATARELNYHVNELARSLRTGQSNTIGVIVTDISNEYFGKLVFYIQEEAKKHGYLVVTSNSNECLDDFDSISTMFINKKLDGIIVVPTTDGQDVLRRIQQNRIPIVQLDRYCKGIEADYVGVNNYGASVTAMNRMLEKGLRRIAIVGYDISLNALTERKAGYVDVMKIRGLYDEALVKDVHYASQEEDISSAISELFALDDKPDAIYFTSRRVFIQGAESIMKMGYTATDGLSLLCFDDVKAYLIANMEISCVVQPIREMAIKAFNLLLEKIEGGTEMGNYIFDAKIAFG